MKFGLTEQQYSYILEMVVRPLEGFGATIWCYGSRARGDHQRYSDLDLMIESKKALNKEAGLIREELEESNFPLKVDLVEFKDFAESYKPGYLKDRVRFEAQ